MERIKKVTIQDVARYANVSAGTIDRVIHNRQVINLDFQEGVTMSWEGRSCSGKPVHVSAVGVIIYYETSMAKFCHKNRSLLSEFHRMQ